MQLREQFAPRIRTEVVSSPANLDDQKRFEDIQIMSLSNVNFKDFEQAVCGVERIVAGSNAPSPGRLAASPRILHQELGLANAEEAELADINLCKTLQAMSEEKMKTDTIEASLSAHHSGRPQNRATFADNNQEKPGEAQLVEDAIMIGKVTTPPKSVPVIEGTKGLCVNVAAATEGTPMHRRGLEKSAKKSNQALDPPSSYVQEPGIVPKLSASNNKRVILSTSQTGKSGTSGVVNATPPQQQPSVDQNNDTVQMQGDIKRKDAPRAGKEHRENHTLAASDVEGSKKTNGSDPAKTPLGEDVARQPDPPEQLGGRQHHIMPPKGVILQHHSEPVSASRVDKHSRPNFIKVQE